MSKADDKKALQNLPASANYEVGYGKPPRETRFRPGESGNPRGRPRGAKNKVPRLNEERLKSIILEEAYRSIKVRDGEKSVIVPIAQAVVRSLAVNAAKGQHRAQRLFAELLSATETADKRLHDQWLATAIEYKAKWERELEWCKRLGIDAPDPIPHPDDIEIDMRAGEVVVKGPSPARRRRGWTSCATRRSPSRKRLSSCTRSSTTTRTMSITRSSRTRSPTTRRSSA